MADCTFHPDIHWQSISRIVQSVRDGGLSDPIARGKLIQEVSCFLGCAVEWYRDQPADDDWLFGNKTVFATSAIAEMSLDDLCTELENSVDRASSDGPSATIPWSQILKFVIPILIELLQRLK